MVNGSATRVSKSVWVSPESGVGGQPFQQIVASQPTLAHLQGYRNRVLLDRLVAVSRPTPWRTAAIKTLVVVNGR